MIRAAAAGLAAALVVAASASALLAAPASGQPAPQVSRTCNGLPICDTWFTSPVLLAWGYDGTPEPGTCQNEQFAQDTVGSPRRCAVTVGLESVSRSVTIRLDQTPPDITGAPPDRPPDRNGWYTRPVTFVPTAVDATSGLRGCESMTYTGPDTADAQVVATCRDNAGLAASRAFPFRYDATAPDVSRVTMATGDRVVRLAWPQDAKATLVRTPGRRGRGRAMVYKGPAGRYIDRAVRNGRRYRYVLTLADAARNTARVELAARPGPHLLAPADRASVAGPPLLRWTSARRAGYYNVQLIRNGRKILSAWPGRPRLQLEPTWRFRGRRYRLKAGEYRWYVWPGQGARVSHEYGRRIGARHFIVAG